MDPIRRDLLRAAAAAPFLFGLEGCARRPAWFDAALAQIRAQGKPGLVLRLPKDPARRCALGHALARRTSPTILICLESEVVDALLLGAREGDDLLRIDGEGLVLDGGPLDLAELLRAPSVGSAPPSLPYGVSIGTAAGCAETAPCLYDACARCGMAAVAPRAREFVKFLAR